LYNQQFRLTANLTMTKSDVVKFSEVIIKKTNKPEINLEKKCCFKIIKSIIEKEKLSKEIANELSLNI
jgi:hypothetical protein